MSIRFITMSAINITNQIPSNIVTVEQLFVWCGTLMATLYPTKQILETEAGGVNVMQSGIFKAADGKTRIFIRGSIELNPNYLTDTTTKLWMKAIEEGQVSLPSGFTSA